MSARTNYVTSVENALSLGRDVKSSIEWGEWDAAQSTLDDLMEQIGLLLVWADKMGGASGED